MLVLTRKVGEEILIGGHIRITVTLIDGNRVRLGIEAPEAIKIIRGELEPRYPHLAPDYRVDAPGGP